MIIFKEKCNRPSQIEYKYDKQHYVYAVKQHCIPVVNMSIWIVNTWPTVTVQNCSLPFTYNGQLYEQCVQTVTDCNGPCNKFACVVPGGALAYCIPPTGDFTCLFSDIAFVLHGLTIIIPTCTCICSVHRYSVKQNLCKKVPF